MSDLIAVNGSFEWAMLELKAGGRVSRAGWNGKGMYLVRNPGLTAQTVQEGDWRAEAGVPVNTIFDYLPNIEIFNADGNFVPWVPSQTDIEANDWNILAGASGYDLIVDITNGFWDSKGTYATKWYGLSDLKKIGKYEIIENNTPGNSMVSFYLETGNMQGNVITIGLYCDAENYNNLDKFLAHPVTIMVDGTEHYLQQIKSGSGMVGEAWSRTYALPDNELMSKFKTQNQTHRFYCKWDR